MDFLVQALDMLVHVDVHLARLSSGLGPWMYILLFAIIFAETGLVIAPILPGDSLLFAVGALCALDGSGLSIGLMAILLFIAGVTGDAVNYSIGKKVGPGIFRAERSRLLNRAHLLRAQAFYERHGGKTIVLARFMPIIRTFAPFVAGIGKMQYRRFVVFNVAGAAAWVGSFLMLGYWFGNLPIVKSRFHYVILGIIVLSVLPAVIEAWRNRQRPPASALVD